MAVRFGQARGEDVAELIAKKQFAKAIEIIKSQLKAQKNDPRIRLQLADVLVMAGRPPEAVAVLIPLADEYAREGFAAKAIAVLKRIQKIDPQRRDIEARLASLIEEKQRQATVPIASVPARLEIGFEEIQPGMELGLEPMGMETAAMEMAPEPEPPARSHYYEPPPPVEDRDFGDAGELLLEPEVEPEPAAPPPPAATHGAPETEPELMLEPGPELHLSQEAEPEMEPEEVEPEAGLIDLGLEGPPDEAEAELAVEPTSTPEPELSLEVAGEAEPEILLEADASEEPSLELQAAAAAGPMGDDLFAQELMSIVEDIFPTGPETPPAPSPAVPADEACSTGGRQIVVSPLFRDFSVDELVAIIQGLKLLCYDAGEIILGEGEAGDSLYMLSAGRVKAFKRNKAGKQALLGEMSEGAFFGEISVLTGKPRTATVVAATGCELLELDRRTLQEIASSHPRVWDVLREFADRRIKAQTSG